MLSNVSDDRPVTSGETTDESDAPESLGKSGIGPGEADFRCGFVALVGRANVGKSTLLNALVGEHVAIVSPRPQTTRRRILGLRSEADVQAIFVDTPGVHKPRTGLGRYMIGEARESLPESDLVVWVVDVSKPPTPTERTIAGWLRSAGKPLILVMNKSDLLAPEHIRANSDAFLALCTPDEWLMTIATQRYGLAELWDLISARLPEGPPLFPIDQLTDQSERAMVAELVRESALRHLGEEVPHGVAAIIEEWTDRPNGTLYLECTLVVEKEAHKPIVIGDGGAMIRRIGTRARKSIESLLDRPVYLDLHVKVRESWRSRESELRRLGYG
jgi:GTP-binding protein Era